MKSDTLPTGDNTSKYSGLHFACCWVGFVTQYVNLFMLLDISVIVAHISADLLVQA